jgi:hypothetical protein
LAVIFDVSAGAGNYRIDGPDATAAVPAGGVPIPPGGGTLIVTGMDNIKNFSMISQAAAMPFVRYLFK